MKHFQKLTLIALSLFVASCASNVRNDVAVFHDLPAANGASISITALKEENKDGIEFGQYAILVATALEGQGYEIKDGDSDLVATLDYSRSEGRDKMRSMHGGRADQRYWNSSLGFFWGYSDPFYRSPFDNRSDVMIMTVYAHELKLLIDDGDGKRVYEGTVIAENRSKELAEMMPYLVEAMFTDFPGESGKTKHILIEKDKG